MLKFGNKEFRNLQEQVKKNMDDILFILQEEGVLNEFGIKVVGQEESAVDMPTVEDYKENNPDWGYGDAYAIGTEEPYELYILTRANGTHPNDYWFNIGEFPVPGPQGPAGAEGPQGPQGEQGNPGVDGTSAGFGVISTTVTTLTPGSDATVSVVASGPDSSKNFSFSFGIPRGADGTTPTVTVDWGEIGGTLSDQTDLVNALQGKQNTLVSGTNIKTINNNSLLGSGDITIDGKNNVLDLGSASSVTEEQLALLEADESLLIYATYGAYGKQLYVFRAEYTTGNLTYTSIPNKGSDNVEFLTLVINKSTRAITKSASNLYVGVSKIEIDGATYTPTMGKVILPTYPSPSGNIDIAATATATQVSPTVPASASVTVDTSGDTPVLEFSFEIPQGEKGETGATGATGPQGPEGPQGPAGQDGQDGADGADGQDGITPHIGANGDWYIGDTDTGVHAQGVQGPEGPQGPTGATGPAGQDGLTTEIYVNGQTYTQSGGVITLPNYPTPSSPTVGDFVAGPGIVIDEDLGNNKVSIEVDQESIPFKVDLATVATSGNYNDLTNKPTIPVVSANPTVTTGTLTAINIDGVGYSVPSGGTATVLKDDVVIVNNSSNELTTSIGGYIVTGSGELLSKDLSGYSPVAPTIFSFSYDCLDGRVSKYKDGYITYGGTLTSTIVFCDANLENDVTEVYTLTPNRGDSTNYIPDDTTYISVIQLPDEWNGTSLIGSITIDTYPSGCVKIKSISISSTAYEYIGKVDERVIPEITPPTPANMVTTDTEQTITGEKKFEGNVRFTAGVTLPSEITFIGQTPYIVHKPNINSTVTVSNALPSSDGRLATTDNIPIVGSGNLNLVVNGVTSTFNANAVSDSTVTLDFSKIDIIYINSDTSTTSGTLSAEDLAKIKDHPSQCLIRKWGSAAQYTQYYELTEISYTSSSQTVVSKYVYELVQVTAANRTARGRKIEITASTGAWTFTNNGGQTPTLQVSVNGATYTPNSTGVVNLGTIGGLSTVTATTETWTFTLSDNSTVTKTIVTGVTAS